MPRILTPTQIWSEFDDSLDLTAVTLNKRVENGIVFEDVSFLGRETGDGRVRIFGVFASDEKQPADETVLIFPDSTDTVDYELLKLFVEKGYSAFMVDYRGDWENTEYFTLYPGIIDYANTLRCGRHKDFVDDTAEKTSWYEWVGVGIYARRYIIERTGSEHIAVLGLRDGGEIAWKLGVARQFSCIIPVCAVGWKAYSGISKFIPNEQALDDERYRFIAGVDSQAYAPYVKCPVMIMCSTNDSRFDYDRAYDTFSRINNDFAADSIITYSVRCSSSIGVKSCADMFMFLDKFLKKRLVFIPAPAEVNVAVDEDSNLVAVAEYDNRGIVEEAGVFMAEDCIDSSLREWTVCDLKRKISEHKYEFFLNVYEKTTTLFVLAYIKYTNGFTIWSKIAVKKVGGSFRNSCGKCRIIYTSKNGIDGFTIADPGAQAVGGMFFTDSIMVPQIVKKEKEINGIYSVCGLTTYRINNPRFAPDKSSVLKLDIFCDNTSEITLTLEDVSDGKIYKLSQSVLGGVWQSLILDSGLFKSSNGESPSDFTGNMRLCINGEGEYAVNNVMWL